MDTRADVKQHSGDFRTIIAGINSTMDTTMQPLLECIHVLKKMSLNDYTEEVTGQIPGNICRNCSGHKFG